MAIIKGVDLTPIESQLSDHAGNTANPHATTAAQVGLGNVNNTSDAAKPVSAAQQGAINAASFAGSMVDLTASRSLGVTYTNTTGRPIFVFFRSASTVNLQDCSVYLAGVQVWRMDTDFDNEMSVCFMVCAGMTYRIVAESVHLTMGFWGEIR